MPTVFANGLSILHKGDGLVQTCAIPDVCNTPTPAGPVPIPYVNVAMDSDLVDGTQEVKVEGQSLLTRRSVRNGWLNLLASMMTWIVSLAESLLLLLLSDTQFCVSSHLTWC